MVNVRRLMDMGVYGRVHTAPHSGTVSMWMSMGTSESQGTSDSNSRAIWSILAQGDSRTALLGLTPDFPPHQVNGVSFASFPASGPVATIGAPLPEATTGPHAHSLSEQIRSASHTRWQTARTLYSGQRWAYFQVVDMGLQTLGADSPAPASISDYYLWLDEQVGSMLELLDDETLLLIVSPRGLEASSTGVSLTSAPADGMFVLIAPNCPLNGEYPGATLLDMAPTVLDLIGREIPHTMQGKSLVAQMQKKDSGQDAAVDEEALLRDRLAGLGYI